MRNTGVFQSNGRRPATLTGGNVWPLGVSRRFVVGTIMMIALLAFELFNFDTTRYALQNLLGEVRFVGIHWATILAIAFCSIDFAGLARLFTPQQGDEEPTAVWYLMGAWLLGATMNAVMTWWAVSLTLLSHDFGNEVLSRQQLLQYVPIFVATLVWLTRILFIGAFSVAGEHVFDLAGRSESAQPRPAARPERPQTNGESPSQRTRIRQRPSTNTPSPPTRPGGWQRTPAPMRASSKKR